MHACASIPAPCSLQDPCKASSASVPGSSRQVQGPVQRAVMLCSLCPGALQAPHSLCQGDSSGHGGWAEANTLLLAGHIWSWLGNSWSSGPGLGEGSCSCRGWEPGPRSQPCPQRRPQAGEGPSAASQSQGAEVGIQCWGGGTVKWVRQGAWTRFFSQLSVGRVMQWLGQALAGRQDSWLLLPNRGRNVVGGAGGCYSQLHH